jgi:hypothetical protein
VRPTPGRWVLVARRPGGIAALKPPATLCHPCRDGGKATRMVCQTVAGGRTNAETSGQRLKSIRHPDGVPENRAECARDAPPQQLDGQEPFLETSAGVRATPSGSAGSCVPCPGGIAALNPRLLTAIPCGMGVGDPAGLQTVAGGRSNARTSRLESKNRPCPVQFLLNGVPEEALGRRAVVCEVTPPRPPWSRAGPACGTDRRLASRM